MVDKIKAAALAAETQRQRGENFIIKARSVHGDLYDYSRVVYVRAASKVTILCPKHGPFDQQAANHVNGQGCPTCALNMKVQMGKNRRLTREDFIAKSKQVHGDLYDYSESVYESSDKPVTISCKSHGPFVIARAEKHHTIAQGCPYCVHLESSSTPERIIAEILDQANIQYYKEWTFDDCRSHVSNRKLRFDFYIPSKSLMIEFHGDQHFKKNKLMHKGDRFERLQEHDRIKANYVLQKNITLATFTTSDLSQLRTLVEGMLNA